MLEAIRLAPRTGSRDRPRPIRHLFLFIGAEPNTDWLTDCGVALDDKGFVLHRRDGSRRPPAAGDQPRGVFAIGDVRAGSVKRVAAAVGEGARWSPACTPTWLPQEARRHQLNREQVWG